METFGSDDAVTEPLLVMAAHNSLAAFKGYCMQKVKLIDEISIWYGKKNGKTIMDFMTPLMMAARCGSLDILRYILSFPEVDVNRKCGVIERTALHHAVLGGSKRAAVVISLMLCVGADPSILDENGKKPIELIDQQDPKNTTVHMLLVSSNTNNPNNPFYKSSDFVMLSYKIRTCFQNNPHDWRGCPFTHPGERPLRRYPISAKVATLPDDDFVYGPQRCDEFRYKGICSMGDECKFSHGVFESGLHPKTYKTRMCTRGQNCKLKLCFFAHTEEEQRPITTPAVSSSEYDSWTPFDTLLYRKGPDHLPLVRSLVHMP